MQVARTRGPLAIRERDVLEGEFASPERLSQLLADGADFETWSARLVEKLPELIYEEGGPRTPRPVRSGAPA